jgi:hypothetical protein
MQGNVPDDHPLQHPFMSFYQNTKEMSSARARRDRSTAGENWSKIQGNLIGKECPMRLKWVLPQVVSTEITMPTIYIAEWRFYRFSSPKTYRGRTSLCLLLPLTQVRTVTLSPQRPIIQAAAGCAPIPPQKA